MGLGNKLRVNLYLYSIVKYRCLSEAIQDGDATLLVKYIELDSEEYKIVMTSNWKVLSVTGSDATYCINHLPYSQTTTNG